MKSGIIFDSNNVFNDDSEESRQKHEDLSGPTYKEAEGNPVLETPNSR